MRNYKKLFLQCFEDLNIPPGIKVNVVKKAFREKILKLFPEKTEGKDKAYAKKRDMFIRLAVARDILTNAILNPAYRDVIEGIRLKAGIFQKKSEEEEICYLTTSTESSFGKYIVKHYKDKSFKEYYKEWETFNNFRNIYIYIFSERTYKGIGGMFLACLSSGLMYLALVFVGLIFIGTAYLLYRTWSFTPYTFLPTFMYYMVFFTTGYFYVRLLSYISKLSVAYAVVKKNPFRTLLIIGFIFFLFPFTETLIMNISCCGFHSLGEAFYSLLTDGGYQLDLVWARTKFYYYFFYIFFLILITVRYYKIGFLHSKINTDKKPYRIYMLAVFYHSFVEEDKCSPIVFRGPHEEEGIVTDINKALDSLDIKLVYGLTPAGIINSFKKQIKKILKKFNTAPDFQLLRETVVRSVARDFLITVLKSKGKITEFLQRNNLHAYKESADEEFQQLLKNRKEDYYSKEYDYHFKSWEFFKKYKENYLLMMRSTNYKGNIYIYSFLCFLNLILMVTVSRWVAFNIRHLIIDELMRDFRLDFYVLGLTYVMFFLIMSYIIVALGFLIGRKYAPQIAARAAFSKNPVFTMVSVCVLNISLFTLPFLLCLGFPGCLNSVPDFIIAITHHAASYGSLLGFKYSDFLLVNIICSVSLSVLSFYMIKDFVTIRKHDLLRKKTPENSLAESYLLFKESMK